VLQPQQPCNHADEAEDERDQRRDQHLPYGYSRGRQLRGRWHGRSIIRQQHGRASDMQAKACMPTDVGMDCCEGWFR
jgi:hypothetical protein